MTRSARFNNESTNSGTVIFPEGDVAEISGRITMPLGRWVKPLKPAKPSQIALEPGGGFLRLHPAYSYVWISDRN